VRRLVHVAHRGPGHRAARPPGRSRRAGTTAGDPVERGAGRGPGDLVVAEIEWGRLNKVKDQFVSDRAYLEASVARQKARSRVLAYGMTQAQIASLLANAAARADGTFELLAPQAGTHIQDAFIQGELVQPGRVLFEITYETVRWVEAQVPPAEVARVAVGDRARVTAGQGDAWLEGWVTQIHRVLDETTRTQAVRIEVPDPGHRLHPGVFVDVVVLVGAAEPVLLIPEAAVLRGPDGDWQVSVAAGEDAFKPVEVELVRSAGGLAVIEGPAPGTQVVTQGRPSDKGVARSTERQ
jgi:cobalt-zinc-cadmium efflux system membrane fusion protein